MIEMVPGMSSITPAKQDEDNSAQINVNTSHGFIIAILLEIHIFKDR